MRRRQRVDRHQRDLAEVVERGGHASGVLSLSQALTLVGLPEGSGTTRP